jgi:hypothetical protein
MSALPFDPAEAVMAANTYKKRMKGNWNQGKACKGDGEERQAAKKEIKELIAECDADYKTRYQKSKRSRNEKVRLQHWIAWYTQRVEDSKRSGRRDIISTWMREGLAKAEKKLAELLKKETK